MTTLRILDDNGVTWLWDGEWLDVDYPPEDEPDEGSGYPAGTFEDVVEILTDGGFIEETEHAVPTNQYRQ